MGSSMFGSDSGSSTVNTVVAEDTVTPAVARSASSEGGSLSASQQEAKSRLRGIRSTYNRFSETASAGSDGTTSKLG